jgi:hypothetical protein
LSGFIANLNLFLEDGRDACFIHRLPLINFCHFNRTECHANGAFGDIITGTHCIA